MAPKHLNRSKLNVGIRPEFKTKQSQISDIARSVQSCPPPTSWLIIDSFNDCNQASARHVLLHRPVQVAIIMGTRLVWHVVPQHCPFPWDFVTLPEEDRAMALGSMHRKLAKIVHVVPEISSRTDRQTHTHTGILITILCNHSLEQSNYQTRQKNHEK